MQNLFRAQQIISNARLGLASRAPCACCGERFHPDDMAQGENPALIEAQTHYGGKICAGCWGDMVPCVCCEAQRLPDDMPALVGPWDEPVCSTYCRDEYDEPSIADDNRLTFGDVM